MTGLRTAVKVMGQGFGTKISRGGKVGFPCSMMPGICRVGLERLKEGWLGRSQVVMLLQSHRRIWGWVLGALVLWPLLQTRGRRLRTSTSGCRRCSHSCGWLREKLHEELG